VVLLQKLIFNALKFTGENGSVQLCIVVETMPNCGSIDITPCTEVTEKDYMSPIFFKDSPGNWAQTSPPASPSASASASPSSHVSSTIAVAAVHKAFHRIRSPQRRLERDEGVPGTVEEAVESRDCCGRAWILRRFTVDQHGDALG